MEYTAGEPCTECGALVEDVTVDREQVGIDIVGGFDFGWPTPVYGPPSMRLVPCGHQPIEAAGFCPKPMGSSGLGMISVNGRNRVPKPPARMTAFIGWPSYSLVSYLFARTSAAASCAFSQSHQTRVNFTAPVGFKWSQS